MFQPKSFEKWEGKYNCRIWEGKEVLVPEEAAREYKGTPWKSLFSGMLGEKVMKGKVWQQLLQWLHEEQYRDWYEGDVAVFDRILLFENGEVGSTRLLYTRDGNVKLQI
ncbi:MAG: hypothetical protein U0641_05830 [Anaerolineae bacterium]